MPRKRTLPIVRRTQTKPGSTIKTGREPQVILDPSREYGPCMSKLTDTRKRFVLAYVWTGGRDAKKAAVMAGLGGNDANAASAGCHLLREELILEAIREEADKFWRSGVLKCAVELDKLIDSENEKIRLDAIKTYLGYAGVVVSQHVTVKHEHRLEDLSGDELISRLVELRAKNVLPEIEYQPVSEECVQTSDTTDAAVLDGEFFALEEAA